jgi:hypothetical protein
MMISMNSGIGSRPFGRTCTVAKPSPRQDHLAGQPTSIHLEHADANTSEPTRPDAFTILGNRTGRVHAQGLSTVDDPSASDVESLLIAALQPRGNLSVKRSRISRPGPDMRCVGPA